MKVYTIILTKVDTLYRMGGEIDESENYTEQGHRLTFAKGRQETG
jgi:hypothetical protein